jgi:hypothetical protein
MRFFSDHRKEMLNSTQIPQSIKNLFSLNDRIIIETGGEPAFVKGDYLENGVVVISGDFSEMMSVPDIRRRNDELVFPSGKRWPRLECWSLSSVVCPNNEEIKYRINEPETSEITRDLLCPVCLEDLSGALVSCCNQHQIHFGCYEGVVRSGRTVCCPTCRGRMLTPITNRTEVSKTFGFYTIGSLNSRREHWARSWVFLAWLRDLEEKGNISTIEERFLLHSLHHFYFLKYQGQYTDRLVTWDGKPILSLSETENDEENLFSDFAKWYASDEHFEHIKKTQHPFSATAIDNLQMITVLKNLYGAETALEVMATIPENYDTLKRFKKWVWLQRFKPCLTERNAIQLLNIILDKSQRYASFPFKSDFWESTSSAV